MTQDNDGWGKPYVAPAANVIAQSIDAQKRLAETLKDMQAEGFVETSPGEWTLTKPSDDGWGTPWPAPAGSADWQTSPPLAPVERDWPVNDDAHHHMVKCGFEWAEEDGAYFNPETGLYVKPDDVGDYLALGEREMPVEHTSKFVYGNTDQDRAEAANACAETPEQEWFVDVPDGELTRSQDYVPTVTPNEETGFYVAYSQGILHAVLAGPYPTLDAAKAGQVKAWDRFQKDGNFALAFVKSDWNPAGLYVAEIPLKARRRGAYGPI